ncbi:MFS transporter [Mesorhizobium koreense]|uniref:MFS transporter n=1 Tax=Mesorhizobium koreense TaxID=3074855 RepID=UPI00287B7B05|nr:MFS transporter [Mesorhizobium sp. WR6]
MPTAIHTGDPYTSDIDGRYAWIRLAVSMLIATLGGAGMWAVVVVLPAVQAEFSVDRSEASLPYTLTMVGFAVGNVLIGRAVDRYGYMLPAMVAAIMMGCGFVAASASGSLAQFALAHGFLIGIGTAATFGPLIADLSHWFRRHRGKAVAAAACGNYLAGVIWPIVIEAFMRAGGWREAYLGVGIICVVAMVPLLFLMRRKSPHHVASAEARAHSDEHVRPIAVSPATLQFLLILAGLGCCVAMSMPQVHMVAYCTDLGYGAAAGAHMLSLMLAGGVVSRLSSGVLADRIGGIPTLLIGSVLQCVALFLYIPFDGLASLYVVSLVFGLAQGGIVPCYAIIVREYLPAAEAGKRVGIVIMATIAGMAIGGWISGWIYDQTGSYEAAFLNGIVWNLMNISVMTVLLFRSGRGASAAPA